MSIWQPQGGDTVCARNVSDGHLELNLDITIRHATSPVLKAGLNRCQLILPPPIKANGACENTTKTEGNLAELSVHE